MSDNCPVCTTQLKLFSTGDDSKSYNCPKCGQFTLTGTAAEVLPNHLGEDKRKRAILSHALRKMQRNDQRPSIDSVLATAIIENGELPSPFEQAANLVVWMGENSPVPGERMWIQTDTHQGIIGAGSDEGVSYILDYLINTGILEGGKQSTLVGAGRAHVTLSFAGWQQFYDLQRGRVASRKAFMAMQYRDPILDKIVKEVFAPAVKRTGFTLSRLDENPSAGLIDDRLRIEIRTSRFLIVDLTHGNRGAYWEAGYAEGLGKPVIYTCRKKEFDAGESHFDTNHHLTVLWEEDDLGTAAEALVTTIRATLPDEATLTDN